MTTSGVSTGTMTAAQMVTAAMQELGVLSAAENPTGDDLELGLRALNWQIKSWTARGLTSWRDMEGQAVFPAGTATIALTPYCLDVTAARVVQSQGYERILQRWELAQYRQIPNKQTRGYPTAYSISKTDTTVNMTVWPVPSVATTVIYDYVRVPDDVTDGGQTVDLPQQWTELCYLALAARLAQALGVTRVDPSTAQIVAQRAATLEQLLLDQDRPASIYMGSALYEPYF